MTLSEIRQLLSTHELQLTKSLGQNFLHDQNQLRKIVAAAELTQADKVLEIGPGLGPLTELLLQTAGEVLAIEKDARLVRLLENRFPAGQASGPSLSGAPVGQASLLSPTPKARVSHPGQYSAPCLPDETASATAETSAQSSPLRLIHADALDFLRRDPRDWTNWKMVSNLPYSVASPILVDLAQNPQGPRRIVATLQIEVARRLAATAGDADYGVLTVLVQLDYEPSGFFRIPATCFYPEPDVDSACVTLQRRPAPLLAPELRPAFSRIVKQAFSQRRKMMLKLLKPHFPEPRLDTAFRLAGLPPQTRAESVSVQQFVRLAQTLAGDSGHG